jgi:hypothetical protein
VAALALTVTAIVLAVVPVRNDVQDCGAPVAFLLAGRVNAPPPEPAVEVTRCSDLAGRRVGASVLLVVAAGTSAIGWALVADKHDRRAWEAWVRSHDVPASEPVPTREG